MTKKATLKTRKQLKESAAQRAEHLKLKAELTREEKRAAERRKSPMEIVRLTQAAIDALDVAHNSYDEDLFPKQDEFFGEARETLDWIISDFESLHD
jgi:hypothetical protein